MPDTLLSPDGQHVWDGHQWLPVAPVQATPPAQPPLSPDGRWWWDGSAWQPIPAVAATSTGSSLPQMPVVPPHSAGRPGGGARLLVVLLLAVSVVIYVAAPAFDVSDYTAANLGFLSGDLPVQTWMIVGLVVTLVNLAYLLITSAGSGIRELPHLSRAVSVALAGVAVATTLTCVSTRSLVSDDGLVSMSPSPASWGLLAAQVAAMVLLARRFIQAPVTSGWLDR